MKAVAESLLLDPETPGGGSSRPPLTTGPIVDPFWRPLSYRCRLLGLWEAFLVLGFGLWCGRVDKPRPGCGFHLLQLPEDGRQLLCGSHPDHLLDGVERCGAHDPS